MLGHALQSVGALAADIAIGAEQDAGVAEKGTDPADRFGRSWSRRNVPFSSRDHKRRRQKGGQKVADGDGTRAGSAAAVRAGEGLVGVVVHQVDAHVARPDDAEDRIHVGPIEIEQGPAVVQQPGDLGDLGIEQTDACWGWSS